MLKLLVFSLLSQLQPASVGTIPAGGLVPQGTIGIVMPLPISIPGPAGKDGAVGPQGIPGQSIIGPQGPPGVAGSGTAGVDQFSIASFGAVADGGQTDSAPAFQAAARAGSLVRIPASAKPFGYAGPTYVKSGVTIEGVSPSASQMIPTGLYTGPCLLVGVAEQNAAQAAAHRPPATALDASASSGRWCFDTLASTPNAAILTITSHPMQLGYQAASWASTPVDYWTGKTYTFEVLAEQTGPWTDFTYLIGTVGSDEPAPYGLCAGAQPGAFHWPVKYAGQPPGTFTVYSFQAPVPGPWGLCMQFDTTLGLSVWCNGKALPVTSGIHGPGAQPPPGTPMQAHNGVFPLIIGSMYGPVPTVGGVSGVRIHGANFTAGGKYVVGKSIQTAVTGVTVNDNYRYFTQLNTPALQTIGFLALTDPPATHLRINGGGGWGIGVIVNAARPQWSGSNVTIRNVGILTNGQPAVLVGEISGLTLDTISATGGLQGIGSLGGGISYVVKHLSCVVGGGDAAVVIYNQEVDSIGTQFSQIGRNAARVFGSVTSTWERCYGNCDMSKSETFMQFLGGQGGNVHTVTNLNLDDESAPPTRAIIEMYQGAAPGASDLEVNGLFVSQAGGVPLLNLLGPGLTNIYPMATVHARRMLIAKEDGDAIACQASGGGWKGSIDLLGTTGAAKVSGLASQAVVSPAVTSP